MKKILIVEDDIEIADSLFKVLNNEGYDVITANSAEEASVQIKHTPPDLILLDLMLPGESGMDFFKKLDGDIDPVVIMVTALGEPIDNIIALEMGVDDYVTKPFHMELLLAKIRSALRKKTSLGSRDILSPKDDSVLDFNGLTFYPLRRYLRDEKGTRISLTSSESNILFLLLKNRGAVLSREILISVLSSNNDNSLRTIDLIVSRLRKKLNSCYNSDKIIETVRNSGYLLK